MSILHEAGHCLLQPMASGCGRGLLGIINVITPRIVTNNGIGGSTSIEKTS